MTNWRKPLIFLLTLLSGKQILRYMREFEKLEHLPREELLAVQQKKLHTLLQHAYEQVPYYHDLFDRLAIVIAETVDVSRFLEIPALTKDDIRRERDALHSRDKRRRCWYKNTSGGSTGSPVTFLQDKQYKESLWAQKFIFHRMLGKDVGEKEVRLWGSERDVFRGSYSLWSRVLCWLYNRVELNSFRMSEKRMREYVKTINTDKPVSLWGYVSSLYELARFIKQHNVSVHSPKAILATSGTVSPELKTYISEAFNAPVYNQYGSREAGGMATECRAQQGLHVCEYLFVFEILDDRMQPTKPEEMGEVYVTSLTNYSMPLIRYKIGDTAAWAEAGSCRCGRQMARIQDVHGRVTDHFILSDGTLVHGQFFAFQFYFKSWVQSFQIVQHTTDDIECFIVRSGEETNVSDLNDIRDAFQKLAGETANIRFTFTEDIPPTPSGKHRYTISQVERS